MDFSELIQRRQSVRAYSDRPVETEKLRQLAEAVRLAPSACNAQPWTLILVDEPALKDAVAQATHSKTFGLNIFATRAPVLAVLVMENPKWTVRAGALIQRREFPLIDIGIAAAQFCLQASDLGLATCMMGWFDEKTIKKLLHIPRRRRIGLVISLGYPPPDYPLRPKSRKDHQAMCRYNRY
jgi:nitroreductase